MTESVKVKWAKLCKDERRFAKLGGVDMIACPTDCGGWVAHVFLDLIYREGVYRKTMAEAQADAIRLGRWLVEDTLRAVLEIAKDWGVEVDDD